MIRGQFVDIHMAVGGLSGAVKWEPEKVKIEPWRWISLLKDMFKLPSFWNGSMVLPL